MLGADATVPFTSKCECRLRSSRAQIKSPESKAAPDTALIAVEGKRTNVVTRQKIRIEKKNIIENGMHHMRTTHHWGWHRVCACRGRHRPRVLIARNLAPQPVIANTRIMQMALPRGDVSTYTRELEQSCVYSLLCSAEERDGAVIIPAPPSEPRSAHNPSALLSGRPYALLLCTWRDRGVPSA